MSENNQVLIIGGGITGLQTTKDLIERGYNVILVEKEPNLGGKVAQLDETFPVSAVSESCSLCYPLCYLLPEISKLYLQQNLKVYTYSEVESINKSKNKYEIIILKKSRYVDENKCNGCGKCIEVCPIKDIPNEFDFNISKRTAIYQPMPGSITPQHLIDANSCLHFKDGSCNECEKICPYNAIDFKKKEEKIKVSVNAIVIATGFDQIDPSFLVQYGYKYPNVVTSLQFERINSINGPTRGKVLRPSDNKEPKSIAFIQCVGSRTNGKPNCVSYCSTVCCMYSSKEALNIRKKKIPDCECYIFNTEKRGYGKQYYDMILDAEHNWGVKYINGRVANIVENPENHNLIIRYEDISDGKFYKREFEMVVLAAALTKTNGKEKLAKLLNKKLDSDGLFDKETIEELEKDNVFIGGFARFPMNIPDSIADASAIASKISQRLVLPLEKYSPDDTETEKLIEYESELIAKSKQPKIAVFYCEFYDKISKIIDLELLKKEISKESNIIIQEIIKNAYTQDGKKKILNLISANNINRVIFTSGSPRYYEDYFGNIMEEANLNRHLMEIVDLREQNAYIHRKDKEKAFNKALELVKMAIAKVKKFKPLFTRKVPITQKVLVINSNSNLTGVITADALAKQGIETFLIQDNVVSLKYDDSLVHSIHLSRKELDELIKGYKKNKLIRILENSTIKKLEGFAGNYKVTIHGEKSRDESEQQIDVGAIIIAGGAMQSKPPKGQFEYGNFPLVMTQSEFEDKLNNGEIDKKIENIAFLLCVNQKLDLHSKYFNKLADTYGSKLIATSNCSNVCCSKAIQDALSMKKINPNAHIYIIYKDLQLTGGILEKIYRDSKKSILYLRYDSLENISVKASKKGSNNSINIIFKEINTNTEIEIDIDALVLATPICVPDNFKEIAKLLKVRLEKYGFLQEEHSKVLPLNSTRKGIFICGNSQWPNPLDIEVSQALGAAIKAANFLSKGYIETNPQPAVVNKDKCIGCGTCLKLCPYKAITFDISIKQYVFGDRKIRKADISPILCQSCGICVSECPVNAISIPNSNDGTLLNQILEFVYEKTMRT
ncbi:MAG: FAD-dependent oxidoreductase [Promethearchaeota archaeon]